MPGAIFGDQLIFGVVERSHLQAMADGRVKLFYRRFDAHALGRIHAIAYGCSRATAGWRREPRRNPES